MAPGTSWWLWVLGTLVGLSPRVISKLHCPQGQYQVEQGSWCCQLCNPDHHAQRQCESCRICVNGFPIQSCNITTNTECACPKGQQCRDKECTSCDPQPTHLLSTPQYTVRSTHQHPATTHQHPTNTHSAYYSETAGTSAPTGPAQSPPGTVPSSQVSIYILLILCGLILTIFIHGTWLILKKRNRQLKKEQGTTWVLRNLLPVSNPAPFPWHLDSYLNHTLYPLPSTQTLLPYSSCAPTLPFFLLFSCLSFTLPFQLPWFSNSSPQTF
ncbi:CD27 antigen isoform X2 [Phascolarctos cinereus]